MDEFDQKMEISEQPQEEIVEKIPGRDVYETVSSLVSALLVVVLVFTFLVRLMGVSGPSMIPTLQDGDRLLVVNSLLCGDYQCNLSHSPQKRFPRHPLHRRKQLRNERNRRERSSEKSTPAVAVLADRIRYRNGRNHHRRRDFDRQKMQKKQ